MAIIDLKLCHSTDFHGYFDPQISFKCLTIIWGGCANSHFKHRHLLFKCKLCAAFGQNVGKIRLKLPAFSKKQLSFKVKPGFQRVKFCHFVEEKS